jgi:two-component system chemotaxis response regulator CheY
MKILIVDDATTARIFAKKCLTGIGFHDAEFIQAKHGLDAIEKLKDNRVDLILTDLMMPEMDGETLLTQVKMTEEWQDIPVVIVSSAGNAARRDLLMEMGAKGVLSKPFSTSEMFEVLKDFLEEEEDDDDWGE